MPDYKQMLYHIEVHDITGIQIYFEEGGDPNEVHGGVPLFTTMVEMYTRSPRFKECVKTFVDAGLQFDDPALLSVLMDDAEKLMRIIQDRPAVVSNTYTRFNNAYTPLSGGSLLHFCAEYNAVTVLNYWFSRELISTQKPVWTNTVLAGIRPFSIR
jgi:hypothetical protein